MSDIDAMVRRYYQAFNERRFADAAGMLSDDADIQHRPNVPLRGPDGYMASAGMATESFPDLRLEIVNIVQQGEAVEVDLLATGTHEGDWTAAGVGTLKATGTLRTFRVRETLEIRAGRIIFASLNYNLQELFGTKPPDD